MLRQMLNSSVKPFVISRILSSAAPAAVSVSVDKEALMKLRKRTGYSYVNCRKALVKFGPENLADAEKWLKEQARTEGWAKAAKLSSRTTNHGLVAVQSTDSVAVIVELSCETDFVSRGDNFKMLVRKQTKLLRNLSFMELFVQLSSRTTNHGLVAVQSTDSVAVIVELSCETDFVSRGDNFKMLLEKLVTSVMDYARKNAPKSSPEKIVLVNLDLNALTDTSGKPLSEIVAMTVGKLGENITVRTIMALYAPSGSSLHSAAHPRDGSPSVNMGKFVSVIALRRAATEGMFPTEKLGAQICQHVIGMRSETLGEPSQTVKVEKQKEITEETKDELNDFAEVQTPIIDEDETALLRQAFMLNPSQTVYDYVSGHQAEIVDFVRLRNAECGTLLILGRHTQRKLHFAHCCGEPIESIAFLCIKQFCRTIWDDCECVCVKHIQRTNLHILYITYFCGFTFCFKAFRSNFNLFHTISYSNYYYIDIKSKPSPSGSTKSAAVKRENTQYEKKPVPVKPMSTKKKRQKLIEKLRSLIYSRFVKFA
ncbi:translation elongation factor Ts [Necator americanus]|uniref:Elongation factor Ts, mitochondrial n=1 Tax=Necator americanus TaxID=51031 RepID=W2TDV0_NECAM|nr:translation elongation factor Ts [Necator americanus]ETN79197.1 translation elongation factor Ts [Necator americanus]